MRTFTPERIRSLFGSIYPAWEYELDARMQRTGRRRPTQFASYPKPCPWQGSPSGGTPTETKT